MKLYLATSWKNEAAVKAIAAWLRVEGFEVYCFAELGDGQHIFMWPDVTHEGDDGITALKKPDSIKAFAVDKAALDWCDCLILILPCGRDAHLEAGYAKGQGKLLYIVGGFPCGEFSNMYHLADGLFYSADARDMVVRLNEIEESKGGQ